MAGGQTPGSTCGYSSATHIDEGTLACWRTPPPGTVCRAQPSAAESTAADMLSGRLYAFVFVEMPMSDGTLVRKVYVSATEPYLKSLKLDPLQELAEVMPERYGLHPRAPGGSAGVAEHTLGIARNTPYVSASSLPDGTPRMQGRSVYIDIAKAEAAGVRVVSTAEIVTEIERYVARHPHLRSSAAKLIQYIRDVDKEVLLQGSTPRVAVYGSKQAMQSAIKVARFGRVLSVVGVAFTAYDVTVATQESVRLHSPKPLAAEGVRQVGGWAGAVGGFKLGFGAGAAVGIETGPGLVITGLVGGIIVGTMGYFGADWLADKIHEN